MAEASAEAVLDDGTRWSLTGEYGTGGDGNMVDYDWLVSGVSDWSDRSVSPDTRLEALWGATLAVSRPFAEVRDGGLGASFTGGLAAGYLQVKWTAYGGHYLYTDITFRDTEGDFTAGQKGISYRQGLPLAFVTTGASLAGPGWNTQIRAEAGVCLGIQDQDDHWLRDLRFFDKMDAAPAAAGEIEASADLAEGWALVLQTRCLRVFPARGSTTTFTISTGAKDGTAADAAGADFLEFSGFLGLRAAYLP